jgi:DNA-binding NarL/FixJ family response regulator
LADHRTKIRFALRTLLEQWLEFDVIGEAENAKELLTKVEASCPDLVLLDWKLRGQDSVTLLPALRKRCTNITVIVLGGRMEWREAALDAGADAFFSKGDPPDQLLTIIKGVQDQDNKEIKCNPKELSSP